ncbi:MAG: hypothetical protein R3C17_09060 [Planctomycetaceae bacterium]
MKLRCLPAERAVDLLPYWSFLFNGKPQAQAKQGNDACGLPLND